MSLCVLRRKYTHRPSTSDRSTHRTPFHTIFGDPIGRQAQGSRDLHLAQLAPVLGKQGEDLSFKILQDAPLFLGQNLRSGFTCLLVPDEQDHSRDQQRHPNDSYNPPRPSR